MKQIVIVLIIVMLYGVTACNTAATFEYPVRGDGVLLYTTTDGTRYYLLSRTTDGDLLTTLVASTGKTAWKRPLPEQEINPRVFTAGDYLIVSCKEHSICILDAETGAETAVLSSPITLASSSKEFTLNNDIFYYLCDTESICAYHIPEHRQLWKQDIPGDTVSFPFTVRARMLMFMTDDHTVVAMHTEDGTMAWKREVTPPDAMLFFTDAVMAVMSESEHTADLYAISDGTVLGNYIGAHLLGIDNSRFFITRTDNQKRLFSAVGVHGAVWDIVLSDGETARFRIDSRVASVVSDRTIRIIDRENGDTVCAVTPDADRAVDVKKWENGKVWIGVKRNDEYCLLHTDCRGTQSVAYCSDADYAELFGIKHHNVYLKTIVFSTTYRWIYKKYSEDGTVVRLYDIPASVSLKFDDLWLLLEPVQHEDYWELSAHYLD